MVSNALLQRSSSPVRWWGPPRSPICSAGIRISATRSACPSPVGPESSRRRRCRPGRSSSRRSGRRSSRARRLQAGSSGCCGLRSSSGSLRRTPRRRARSPGPGPGPGARGPGAGSCRTCGSGGSGGSRRSGARRPRADSDARAVRSDTDGGAASPARAADPGPESGSGDDAADLASVAPGSAGRGAHAGARGRATAPRVGADPPQAGADAARRRHTGHLDAADADGRRERLTRRDLRG